MAEGLFAGQVVLITGAAGGIGARAAERFAQEGATLALSDLNGDRLSPLVTRLSATGADVFGTCLNVSSEKEVSAHIAGILDRYGRLDVAVNNAGLAHAVTQLSDLDLDVFEKMMSVNARGVFLGLKHQLPPMLAAGRGAIVNVASVAGLVGAGGLSAYAASKHAIIGLTRSAADEVASKGVRVNAVCPSFAETPMFDGMAQDLAQRRGLDTQATRDRFTQRVPMRRIVTPDEVVEAILWLASPRNTAMTGQALAVDGGLTAI